MKIRVGLSRFRSNFTIINISYDRFFDHVFKIVLFNFHLTISTPDKKAQKAFEEYGKSLSEIEDDDWSHLIEDE